MWNQQVAMPSALYLPTGVHILAPELDVEYNGYVLRNWMMDEPPEEIPEIITSRQFYQQLYIAGIMTANDAMAAAKSGTLSTTITNWIATLPVGQRWPTEIMLSADKIFKRNHPTIIAMIDALGYTPEQGDTFWLAASKL